ncbi:hypothetical protein IT396_03520 [Candidatus Nomurabacteria bacterium]|nr:hypothetical protein [Candidatus Nomurabacteria bacterium]
MAGVRHDSSVKSKVMRLRRAGKTYAEIQKRFPIPKSTLSVWLNKKFPRTRTVQLEHLKRARILAAASITKARLAREAIIDSKSALTAIDLPLHNIALRKALLAMLYWAEGSKHKGVGGLIFVNTDPKLAELYISLLRSSFTVEETRFRIRLHLHYYHKSKEAIDFWSKLLDVPKAQFGKIYWKERSKTKKFRQNFMGICFIYYPSGDIRKEILSLGQAIHAILPNQLLP